MSIAIRRCCCRRRRRRLSVFWLHVHHAFVHHPIKIFLLHTNIRLVAFFCLLTGCFIEFCLRLTKHQQLKTRFPRLVEKKALHSHSALAVCNTSTWQCNIEQKYSTYSTLMFNLFAQTKPESHRFFLLLFSGCCLFAVFVCSDVDISFFLLGLVFTYATVRIVDLFEFRS